MSGDQMSGDQPPMEQPPTMEQPPMEQPPMDQPPMDQPMSGGDDSGKSSGTVKFFNVRKGYGFVTDNSTQTDYFVHTSDVSGKPLQEGDEVKFEIGAGNDGREKAVSVTGGTGEDQPRFNNFDNNRGGDSYGGNQGGYGGNQGGYGGNQGGYGGNQGGYGGNQGGSFGGNDGGQKKTCYNWRDSGECRFGDRCRFSHDAN